MAEFTKGEWFVNTSGSKTWIDTQTGLTIAQVYGMEVHPYDANLIAASPDMYEVLEGLYLNSGLVYGEDYDKVEELLAKARGE